MGVSLQRVKAGVCSGNSGMKSQTARRYAIGWKLQDRLYLRLDFYLPGANCMPG
jgi:hypothetical protein